MMARKLILGLGVGIVGFLFAGEGWTQEKKETRDETVSPLQLIEKINAANIRKISNSIWHTPLLKPYFEELQEKLRPYGDCSEIPKRQSWIAWRKSKKACGTVDSPDRFRRVFINTYFPQIVNKALVALGMTAVEWAAIGTVGPESDIDIVAHYTKEGGDSSESEAVSPKGIEITAKILFDTLGVALYGVPTGMAFDAEAYIDATAELKDSYVNLKESQEYRNLAFTLSQVQVFRQLLHPVTFKGEEVLTWRKYKELWGRTRFAKIVDDGYRFNELTAPLENPLRNLGQYTPLIFRLAEEQETTKTLLEKATFSGIQRTYFPEAYFTNEALKHVCYGDDRYSQLLLTLIRNALETHETISAAEVEKFVESNRLGGLDAFIYTVSAGENIGYALHKLSGADDGFTALLTASKYLFRIARALCAYLKVDPDAKGKSGAPHVAYARQFFEVMSQLERLKRGFLPFSTQKDIFKILKTTLERFEVSTHTLEAFSQTLYDVFVKQWARPDVKRDAIENAHLGLHRFGLFWDEEKAAYAMAGIHDPVKKEAAQRLVALLNLVIGVESAVPPSQKEEEKSRLKEIVELPIWEEGHVISKKVKDITSEEFKAFIWGLLEFYRDLIVKDYEKTARHTFESVKLRLTTERFLKKVNN